MNVAKRVLETALLDDVARLDGAVRLVRDRTKLLNQAIGELDSARARVLMRRQQIAQAQEAAREDARFEVRHRFDDEVAAAKAEPEEAARRG